MTDNLPELPETDWMLHMPAKQYEPEWTSNQEGFDADQMRSYALTAIASERARADALEAALNELVALKAMREELRHWELTIYAGGDKAPVELHEHTKNLRVEYDRRKPIAWTAARSLLEKTNDR